MKFPILAITLLPCLILSVGIMAAGCKKKETRPPAAGAAMKPAGVKGAAKKTLAKNASRKDQDQKTVDASRVQAKSPEDDNIVENNPVEDARLAAEVQKVIEPLREMLDSDNLDEVQRAARGIMKHHLADVRNIAIDALAKCGESGLKDLMTMIDDSDKDVAAYARMKTELELHGLDSSEVKTELLMEYGEQSLDEGVDTFSELFVMLAGEKDAIALPLLAGWAEKTNDPEILAGIFGEINLRVGSDSGVTSKADIPAALAEFNQKQAVEAEADRRLDEALGIEVEPLD